MSPNPRKAPSTALGAIALGIAFLAGVGVGALAFGTPAENVEETTTVRAPSAQLFDDLELTADQRRQIDSILADVRRGTDSLMDAARVDLTARATRARRAIEGTLDPQQVRELEERFRTLGPMMIRRVQVNDSLVRVDTIQ